MPTTLAKCRKLSPLLVHKITIHQRTTIFGEKKIRICYGNSCKQASWWARIPEQRIIEKCEFLLVFPPSFLAATRYWIMNVRHYPPNVFIRAAILISKSQRNRGWTNAEYGIRLSKMKSPPKRKLDFLPGFCKRNMIPWSTDFWKK